MKGQKHVDFDAVSRFASADFSIAHQAKAQSGPEGDGTWNVAKHPQKAIGEAADVQGNATLIRNGVTVILNDGDAVFKGDVVETGGNSSVNLVFADGSAIQVRHGSQLALNDGEHAAVVFDGNGDTTTLPGSEYGRFILAQADQPPASQGNVNTDTNNDDEPNAFDAILKLQQTAQKLFSNTSNTSSSGPHGSSTPPGPSDLPNPGSGDIPGAPPIPQPTFPDGTPFSRDNSTFLFIQPAPTLTGADIRGVEGKTTGTIQVATFTDGDAAASDFTATVNWGDGTTQNATVVALGGGHFAVEGAHTYADEGNFTISVTVAGGGVTLSTHSTASVADAPLTASANPVAGVEGLSIGTVEVATFTDTNINAPVGDFTATIDWGDGIASANGNAKLISLGGGRFAVQGTHTYGEEGSYVVHVTVKDVGGSMADATSTATVMDAPLTGLNGATVTSTEGVPAQLSNAVFKDTNPGNHIGDFSAIIDWGDNTSSIGIISYDSNAGVYDVVGGHTYAAAGDYIVSVAVKDDGGASTTITGEAMIANPPLSGSGEVFSATEGASTGPQTIAVFTDPKANALAGDFTARINWGDGSTDQNATITALGNGNFSVQDAHTYAEAGDYKVSVTVNDTDGRNLVIDNSEAQIADAPLEDPHGFVFNTVNGGAASWELATFTDTNPNATFHDFVATIDWGDGSAVTQSSDFRALGNGVFEVKAARAFSGLGQHSINVTIQDKGGSTTSTTTLVNVTSALENPTGLAVNSTAGFSTHRTGVALFTDPNPIAIASDFTATIDWGDGSSTQQSATFVHLANGVFEAEGFHVYASPGQFSINVTINDRFGDTASTTSIATVVAPPTVTTPTITSDDAAGATTLRPGDVLTASATGNADDKIIYEWFSSADGDNTIIGAGATYTVKAGDIGNTIEVIASSIDRNGATVSATSAPTATVNSLALVTAGATAHYTGGGAPVVLDGGVTVSDLESTTANASATVSIAAGFAPGDTLTFNSGTNTEKTFNDGAIIQGSYNSATGVLTLTKAAGSTVVPSVADFQTALQSVTYSAGNSDPTNGGSDTSRTIDWVFNDGLMSSNTVTSTLTTSHVAPTVVTANATAFYGGNGAPVTLDSIIQVNDVDSGDNLVGASIRIVGYSSGDQLHFADTAHITGSFDANIGVLTLSGTDTIADYQAALRSITYSFGGADPTVGGNTTKTILWTVNDGNTVNGSNQVYPSNPNAAQPIDNHQATLGLHELVVLDGIFPTHQDDAFADGIGIPLGAIRTFAGDVVQGGTADAEGQLIAIPSKAALFSLLGNTYGGNGNTTFELPNLGATLAVGQNGNPNTFLGETFGRGQTTLGISNLPNSVGGLNQSFSNDQPSLTVNYLINTGGTFLGPVDMLGEIVPFLGAFAPDGYMLAEGQLLNISLHPALFTILGTTYGGDGITTFALPNLTGRAIIGAGQVFQGENIALGAVTGQDTTTLNATNLPFPHGNDFAFNNQQPSLALNYIIDVGSGIFPNTQGGTDPSLPYLGEIVAYAGDVNHLPQGWLLAAGQLEQISQFQGLFSLLQTTYGGDGITTFRLPDLVGRAIEGIGHDSSLNVETLGEQSGNNSVTLLPNQLPTFPQISTSTLNVTQQTSSINIAPGGSVELNVASNATVTFAGDTGTLKLDDPGFSGTIVGFTGTAPDAVHSDVIDLAGIDFNSGFSESFNAGVLTLSGGGNTATLHFSGFNGTFNFASDGHGGTFIFDPPAPQTPPVVPTSTGSPPSASTSGDTFVFHPGLGAATVSNFDPLHEAIELDHFANLQTSQQLQAAITSDVHGDAMIALGLGDSIVLSGVTAHQLEAVLNTAVHLH